MTGWLHAPQRNSLYDIYTQDAGSQGAGYQATGAWPSVLQTGKTCMAWLRRMQATQVRAIRLQVHGPAQVHGVDNLRRRSPRSSAHMRDRPHRKGSRCQSTFLMTACPLMEGSMPKAAPLCWCPGLSCSACTTFNVPPCAGGVPACTLARLGASLGSTGTVTPCKCARILSGRGHVAPFSTPCYGLLLSTPCYGLLLMIMSLLITCSDWV